MAFQNFINKIEKIVSLSSKFKIGETGQTLLSRFNIQYRQEYEKIDLITKSKNKELIDDVEDRLIRHFKDAYPRKCKNKKGGSAGIMTDMNNEYKIYVVYTLKPIKIPKPKSKNKKH
jgi:hypothetical protein